MLDQRDLALLRDITATISLNHIVAAHTFAQTWQQPAVAAEWAYAALHSQLHAEDISSDVRMAFRDEVARRNESGRVRGILLAKLYVEAMACYEDLAALCVAINRRRTPGKRPRNRTIAGLFEWYLDSQVAEVKEEADRIQATAPPPSGAVETLDAILDVPPLEILERRVRPDVLTYVRERYQAYPVDLRRIFDQYREPLHFSQAPRALTEEDVKPTDRINVLVDVLPVSAGQAQKQQTGAIHSQTSGEVLVHAYNKLKHRFLVSADLRPYSYTGQGRGRTLATPIPNVEVGWLPISEDFVKLLVQNTVTGAKTMEGLADLLLLLDEAGIDLYA